MKDKNMTSETICAIATATGGALGVIRVSGADAITATDKIFRPRKGKSLGERKGSSLTFGEIVAGEEVIDEVLVSVFRAPHSYTGENSTEISCHGSPYILQRVMELLLEAGCRTARPGEFTQRAFLSGRMDLSQAEAVADVIAASSAAAHRLAMNQMRGGVSHELRALREKLIHIASLMELELDFADHEDLEFADRSELQTLAQQIDDRLTQLIDSFATGNALKSGVPVAIIGDANAGKSTLLNQLLGEERAIVSDIRGTTRDVIEDTLNIEGTLFRLIDTAGIRATEDSIEQMGIKRTFTRIDQAQIVLWLIDATEAVTQYTTLAPRLLPLCEGKSLAILLNKADIALKVHEAQTFLESHRSDFPASDTPIFMVSALTGEGITSLRRHLLSSAALPSSSQSDLLITNARHYEALMEARTSISRVKEGLSSQLSGDFISQDLRECIHHLGDIMGEVTSDNVLHNIFRNFCIGK